MCRIATSAMWPRVSPFPRAAPEAFGGGRWESTLRRVHPQSEQRDGRNVFIAEADIAADRVGELRPGMRGRATIVMSEQAAADLDHRPPLLGLVGHHRFLVMGTENFSVREAEALRARACAKRCASPSRSRATGASASSKIPWLRAFIAWGSRSSVSSARSTGRRPVAAAFSPSWPAKAARPSPRGKPCRFSSWLKDQHLLAVESTRSGTSDREHAEEVMRTAATWLNPLSVKVPPLRPDRFFHRVRALPPAAAGRPWDS